MKWFVFSVAILGLGLGLASASYDHYRLPTALRPQKYHLTIMTHLEDPEDLRFLGSVKILIEVLQKTKNITLHSKNLTIHESMTTLRKISGAGSKDNCVSSTAVNSDHDYYIMNTCQELLAGSVHELHLSFSDEVSRKLAGYYRSSYKDPVENETRWLTITQFEPASARLAFPSFDEPNYKARFVVTLGHHQNYTGLSNMPVKELIPHESIPEYVWTRFQESVPMPTYLVAYSVNDFTFKASTLPNGTLFRTWARPNALDHCEFAAEFGPKVLQYYEELFGIKFPLPKMDQMAVPDFNSGAMENWGLVTYREIALLYSSKYGSQADRNHVANVVAHELAHQWFGNLVTMKWWSDLWLNEGFATYVASLGVEAIHPEWRSKHRAAVRALWETFHQDALESSNPISRPIKRASQISETFNVISYKKGSSVIRMMHMFLGDEAFRSGLKSYLQRYEYKNAEQDNLWQSLTQAGHSTGALPRRYEVKTIMDSWTLQTGYPVIHVARDYAAGSAKLTQERFLLNSEAPRSRREGCWWVPLSFSSQEELDFNNTSPKDWLECSKEGQSLPKTIKNLPGSDQWVIFNTKLSVPCKVNYDAQNWQLLIKTLNSEDFESIHVVNRAQLIDDVLYFAWTGVQDYETAMKAIVYLHRERELLPWRAVLNNLIYITRIVRRTPQWGLLKRHMRRLISPIYMHVGGMDDTFASIDDQDQALLKTAVVDWACLLEVGDCVRGASEYLRQWMATRDGSNPVPVNLRTIVYCWAIWHGTEDDWEFLWDRYLETDVAVEKSEILHALGCTREVWLLQRLLEMSFDPQGAIRRQDAWDCFHAVAANPVGILLAKKYFMDNVEAIYKYFYPVTRTMGNLLSSLSLQIIDRADFNEFQAFVNRSRSSLKGIEEAVQQNLELMRITVQWRERKLPQLTKALEEARVLEEARFHEEARVLEEARVHEDAVASEEASYDRY